MLLPSIIFPYANGTCSINFNRLKIDCDSDAVLVQTRIIVIKILPRNHKISFITNRLIYRYYQVLLGFIMFIPETGSF